MYGSHFFSFFLFFSFDVPLFGNIANIYRNGINDVTNFDKRICERKGKMIIKAGVRIGKNEKEEGIGREERSGS